MIFNSVTYILFLSVFLIFYWLLPRIPRLILIFISSLVFYGFWRYEYIWILITLILIDYYAAIFIHNQKTPLKKKLFLAISIIANLGLLAYFKYLIFFENNINLAFDLFGANFHIPVKEVLLPLGISFHTFQSMSYTIDVYRGFCKPEKNLLIYSNFVIFFPQLIAGPIVRPNELVSQIDERPKFKSEDVGSGLRRILIGLFLKVVMADNIAPLVDSGFNTSINALSALDVLVLAFLFGYQIYFDFSAYSHIAIGSARLMGIVLPENFDFPYLSTSPKDFWKRWHISLSSWIRDYLYLPLKGEKVLDISKGGLPVSQIQTKTSFNDIRALFLTWGIMGLWHGANWTFVCWGLWHATLIFLYRQAVKFTKDSYKSLIISILSWVITVTSIMLGWIFFRATNLSQAFLMYSKLLDFRNYTWMGLRENDYLIALIVLVFIVLNYFFKVRLIPLIKRYLLLYFLLEIAFYTVIISLVFIFLRPISQYIYFQF